ncbi:MAG: nicotinamide riboside transporter PnuC [Gammaproteobacteria bacterium]|nr:nicotinamide riboside transporter PnuC [Gammaproteobacteria bacterium]
MSSLQLVLEQARAQSLPEVIAVFSAVIYLLLAIRQNIWCWLFAAISTSIYVGLFVAAKLYMESLLNLFYLAMAAYGWYSWHSGRHSEQKMPVVVWPVLVHARAVVALISLSMVNGYLLSRYTDAAFPYVDSLTTWFAIWATFLVARKVLENWWYWLIIDIASMLIYWMRNLELTAALFVVYVLMIPFGYIAWRHSWQKSAECPAS